MSRSTISTFKLFEMFPDDLDRNLEEFVMVLHNDVSDEDAEEFERIYKTNVQDWR